MGILSFLFGKKKQSDEAVKQEQVHGDDAPITDEIERAKESGGDNEAVFAQEELNDGNVETAEVKSIADQVEIAEKKEPCCDSSKTTQGKSEPAVAAEVATSEAAGDEAASKAEEEARLKAEEEARLKAEEEARIKAEEEARLKAEEEARLKAEEEARLKAEEEARIKAEEEARLKAEEEARLKAEEEARLKAEEEARLKAEEEARLKAEEEERIKAEEDARLKAEEEARLKAEEEERLKAEEEDRLKAEQESAKTEAKPEKASFFSRLKKTRDSLAAGLSVMVLGRKIDEDLYEELETALLTADLGVETTEHVIERLRNESRAVELKDAAALRNNLKSILCEILKPVEQPLEVKSENGPFVILMVGVNGAGKTTTIGKLAQKYLSEGKSVMLAAGDTFRAAAVEQLKEWGSRAGVPVIAQPTGSDSASVLYDALESARARKVDVLICDTAGRLQNKDNLMEELRKIVRVMKKIDPNVPNETLLVLDAATGQNAVSQTRVFTDAVQVSGLVLTKLDGTAKGGVVFALADRFKLPIRYVGIGEKAEDLREFAVEPFVDALIDEEQL